METILIILKALKIDQTVLIQFGLLVLFFNIIAPVLFNKIKEILELRESKTTKLEDHAHHIYRQAEELEEQYKAHIEKTHQAFQHATNKKKMEVVTREKEILKTAEDKLNAEYEQRRAKIVDEVEQKRKEAMTQVDSLSSSLIDKLTK